VPWRKGKKLALNTKLRCEGKVIGGFGADLWGN
jgi:hypothetical protein